MNLARDVKEKKKGFSEDICNQRKTRGNVVVLPKGTGALVPKGTEKAEVLHAFFASVFAGKSGPQQSQAPETRRKVCRMAFP